MSERKCPVCGEEMQIVGSECYTCNNTNCLTFCRSVWIPVQYKTYADRLAAEIDRLAQVILDEFGGPDEDAGACDIAIKLLRKLAAERDAAIKEIGMWSRRYGLLAAENKRLKHLLEGTLRNLPCENQEQSNLITAIGDMLHPDESVMSGQ